MEIFNVSQGSFFQKCKVFLYTVFKIIKSGDVSPENPLVLFDVFEKFSKSVLDGLHTLQGILNFELYLLKAVNDQQIGILEWK